MLKRMDSSHSIRVYLISQLAEIILSDCSSVDEDDDFLPRTSTQASTT